MSRVVAVSTWGGERSVAGAAAAVAELLGATVRTVAVDASDADAAGSEVLAELAEPDTVAGVLPATEDSASGWSSRVLTDSPRPVVVVPAGPGAPIRAINRVLVPLDGSREASSAVAETLALLARHDVDVVVLHLFTGPTVPRFWDHQGHADEAWKTEFLARHCPHPGIRLELRAGEPGESILDAARCERVDLIALGWSQRLDSGRALTVRHTLAAGEVPVLLLPVPVASGRRSLSGNPEAR